MVFHWSLSDSKSPQVSRTLLSILAVLSNAVIWIVSTRPPTCKSSRPFNNPYVIVPKAPITIGIFVTFMFHRFINSLARSRYLSFFSRSFSFILWSAGAAKSTILQILFFLLIIRFGLLAEIRWSVCISKSYRSLCVSFSRTDAGLCIYHLLVWSNLNFLHISQWITLRVRTPVALLRSLSNIIIIIISLLANFSHKMKLVVITDVWATTLVQSCVFPKYSRSRSFEMAYWKYLDLELRRLGIVSTIDEASRHHHFIE